MKKIFTFLTAIILAMILLSSCAHRDCQGRKKTCKTEMGGWL